MKVTKMVYADLSRCIACHACEVACEITHGGVANISVDVVEDRASVPISCRQCDKAACVMACYADALSHAEDGSVFFNKEKCTGCGLCVLACPFGAISLDADLVHKCDLCPDREVPACVTTCPTQALVWGDEEAVAREIRTRAAQKMIRALTSEGRARS
jgi:formate dehydrogenase iron-sulfur subunit